MDIPVFGQTRAWSGECIRRPSNRSRASWSVRFCEEDALWNLRVREVSFAVLNPAHRVLREATIFRPRPTALGTAATDAYLLGELGRWARKHHMPDDLSSWPSDAWWGFLHEQAGEEGATGLGKHVHAVRRMQSVSRILTGTALFDDPWPGQTGKEVSDSVLGGSVTASDDGIAIPSIPPSTWWPLLRAAWTYIHTFAPDILDLRDKLSDERGEGEALPDLPGPMSREDADRLVHEWLADSAHLVPVHDRDFRGAKAGTPVWTTLSLQITGGRSKNLFTEKGTNRGERHRARRASALRAVAEGRTQLVNSTRGVAAVGATAYAPRRTIRKQADIDAAIEAWLADPSHRVPVRAKSGRSGGGGTPSFKVLHRLIFENAASGNVFLGTSAHRRRRRQRIEQAVASGQAVELGGEATYRDVPIACPEFAVVRRPDGHHRPWRSEITLTSLDDELRMVRAACYIFAAGLSLTRDSEIQEIERGALGSHYGSPAVVSRKIKKDPEQPSRHWWIIEPVAEALAVLERLSWHPTHLFASLDPPKSTEGKRAYGRRGILPASDIDFFIEKINADRDRTGLQEIPMAHVRPHMFRKTMAIITGQQPDSEIALGMQLKHAARRALANSLTPAYAKMDANWAKEFNQELESAAARRLVGLLKDRRSGEAVAVGPGAARLHAGLDKVIDMMDSDPSLRAQIADERLQASLLTAEFPDLHLGTLNHCMFDAPQAECQNQLPEAQRGQAPLIGACQPARCRNSVVTRKHAPIWTAEEEDLTAMVKDRSLAPSRREAVLIRLADVQRITRALREQEEGGAA
ncbi:hypothetical protein OIU91_09850 [Streptomyces sp. NBC_01456]|uniref:hypothetical protein n=1 Tax=unclassified Streptomyces TaxID=2593676 RepID=UPI002E34703A|nr:MULTISPECIES: hypothetical protein [unclassified Streptomyces]